MTVPSHREPASLVEPPAADREGKVPPAPTLFGPRGVDPTGLPAIAPERLEVSTSFDPGTTTVRVRGELLQETASLFADAVADLADDTGVGHLVVDLSGATFMDSTGLGALVSLRNQLLARGGRFELVKPQDRVFRLFELTRLDSVFEFVDAG